MSNNASLMALSAREILALTLIGEARGESIEGQVGVGFVIVNRFHSNPGHYKSIHDVCLAPKQFSCWNESDPNRAILLELADKMLSGAPITEPYYLQPIYVASGILGGNIQDNVDNRLHYLTNKLFYSIEKPLWARSATNIKLIGTQVFFNA